MPVSDFLDLHPHDRDAILSLRAYRADSCDGCGVHPDVWSKRRGGDPNAVTPDWVYCRVCDLIEQAKTAGPVNPHTHEPVPESEQGGWRLVLKHSGDDE